MLMLVPFFVAYCKYALYALYAHSAYRAGYDKCHIQIVTFVTILSALYAL